MPICIRGSALGSVESSSKTRPSSGWALRSGENETPNRGAAGGRLAKAAEPNMAASMAHGTPTE
jgi:hypothetical protein